MFLQHGVTVNRGPWLYYKNTRMWRFITAAQPEHEYVVENFGYSAKQVKLCGFSRFDALHNAERDENLILVMPTWRNWLGRESQDHAPLGGDGDMAVVKLHNPLYNGKSDAVPLRGV